jgi:hypothetical protein
MSGHDQQELVDSQAIHLGVGDTSVVPGVRALICKCDRGGLTKGCSVQQGRHLLQGGTSPLFHVFAAES